ncbi:hypothetical protein [Paenibacillus foliorum]|nr:hypothetical protein [Paenibacillus foliorum]
MEIHYLQILDIDNDGNTFNDNNGKTESSFSLNGFSTFPLGIHAVKASIS